MIYMIIGLMAGTLVRLHFHIKDLNKNIKMKNDEIAILRLANIELQQKLDKEN